MVERFQLYDFDKLTLEHQVHQDGRRILWTKDQEGYQGDLETRT